MLDLNQIEQQYPENLRPFKRNILREYLQYKILEIIFNGSFFTKLSFLGGTALRIIHNNSRFSEDLDFDHFGLEKEEFIRFAGEIESGLKREGYVVEMRPVIKNAWHCYIKFPGLLYDNQLSGMAGEKILIQIDTEAHEFSYQPERKILNKFDVFTHVLSTPLDILLSQKFYAALNRKRAKGRDFYDIIFLLQGTKPNYDYLKLKTGIDNGQTLKKKLLSHIAGIDMKQIIKDVEPFLFSPQSSNKIELFTEYMQQIDL